MSVPIQIRDDLYKRWKSEQNVDNLTSLSASEWIDKILHERDQSNNLQEATITPEGRISKALAGQTILFRLKQSTNPVLV